MISVSKSSFSLVLCGKCQVTASTLNMLLALNVTIMHKGHNVLIDYSMSM